MVLPWLTALAITLISDATRFLHLHVFFLPPQEGILLQAGETKQVAMSFSPALEVARATDGCCVCTLPNYRNSLSLWTTVAIA
jgi:hypothetical protein